MITLSYTVAGQLIEPASVPQYLVADTVGVYQVAFTFDADWADMSEKTVVFRNPQVIDPDYRDVPVEFPLDANGQALVPAALLDPGKLFIGVYGTNSTQQLPTIWAPPLQVVPGASPGVEPSDDPALGSVIRTIPQTLTEEEKAQARENIGANEIEGGTPGNVVIIDNNENIADSGISKDNLLIAPQLASNNIKTDAVPYKYRQTGGGIGVGNREYDSIVGGSVVWNQIQKGRNASSGTDILLTYTTDGKLTVVVNNPTASASIVLEWPTLTKNHKYLMYVPNASKANGFEYYVSGFSHRGSLDNWVMNYTGDTGAVATRFYVSTSTANGTYEFYPMCIDLTVLFGATVADYLYTQDNSNVGYACAYLKRMGLLTGAYRPYTATPSLESVSGLQSHKTVGFNLWDEEWETGSLVNGLPVSDSSRIRAKNFTPCFPNTAYNKYSHSGLVINIFWYDANMSFLSYIGASAGQAVTSPQDAYYFKICTTTVYGGTYKHDICVNLSDPTRNGTYEPYTEHTYPLAGIELRGVWVVNSDGSISCDGDTYAPDGTVTRRYGIVTLTGDETWNMVNTGLVSVVLPNMMPAPSGGPGNPHGRAVGYVTYDAFADVRAVHSNTYDKAVVFGSAYIGSISRLYIRDNANAPSVADWESYLSTHPLTVVYELATPTVETATPYDALQICDPLGTEEYVTTGICPVGHETRYPENQVRKLDGLPSDFSTLIAPTEKEFKASATRTTGFKFIYQNQLYKCIANVASGAAYTIGTNVKKTTIAEELDLLS